MKEEQEKIFDEYAANYREVHTKSIKAISGTDSYYFSEYKIKELLRFEKENSISILDIGCGDGLSEVYFSKHFPESFQTGIDISEISIETAKQRKLDSATFVKYDGKVFPFQDCSFDIIFMACVMHHVSNPEQFHILEESKRVLKKGGRFYLFEHNPYNPVTRHLVRLCPFDKGVKLLPPYRVEKLLKKAGFLVLNRRFTVYLPARKLFARLRKIESFLWFLPLGGQYFFRSKKP